MQNKFLLPVALLSFVLAGGFGWKLHQDKQGVYELTLVAGTKTGNYYPFGQAIAEVVVRQNPRRLQANEVQLAIVQNDTAAVASARVVAGLFEEVFHLIVSE